MNINKIITIGYISLLLLLPISTVNANALSPAVNQVLLAAGSTINSEILFENTTNKEINIVPTVIGYNPKDGNLITDKAYIFVKTDIESFKVAPNNTITLNYQITVPNNLPIGTYFNLIILKQTNDEGFLTSENSVGAIDNLSHLVALHISSDSNVKGITSDFAQISMEIVDNGIPFIKDAKVKYIYQNITNYVLTPDGEIQVYNNKGKYKPEYFKINKDKQKLYPGDLVEEIITIKKWNISDLIYPRTILGRFYNGIDENSVSKELQQNSSSFFIITGATILLFGFFLFKSIRDDRRKAKA